LVIFIKFLSRLLCADGIFFYICRSLFSKNTQKWAEATKKQLKGNVLKVLLAKADHTRLLLQKNLQKLKLLNNSLEVKNDYKVPF